MSKREKKKKTTTDSSNVAKKQHIATDKLPKLIQRDSLKKNIIMICHIQKIKHVMRCCQRD